MGFSHAACYDFDDAVTQLKMRWDARAAEVIMVVDTTPKGAKPKRPERKYKTQFEVLGLNRDGTMPELLTPEREQDENDMALALARGELDWSQHGYA